VSAFFVKWHWLIHFIIPYQRGREKVDSNNKIYQINLIFNKLVACPLGGGRMVVKGGRGTRDQRN